MLSQNPFSCSHLDFSLDRTTQLVILFHSNNHYSLGSLLSPVSIPSNRFRNRFQCEHIGRHSWLSHFRHRIPSYLVLTTRKHGQTTGRKQMRNGVTACYRHTSRQPRTTGYRHHIQVTGEQLLRNTQKALASGPPSSRE
nr:hypothetical transcript [Hymenolepis microstoma]